MLRSENWTSWPKPVLKKKADTKKYRRQFWTGLAGNAALVGTISAGFAVASRIPGGQTYCAYASAGLAVVGMTVAYQQRRRAAHAQGKKYNFFKRSGRHDQCSDERCRNGRRRLGGVPKACMPSWAPIWSEPDISHIKGKKAGIKKAKPRQ